MTNIVAATQPTALQQNIGSCAGQLGCRIARLALPCCVSVWLTISAKQHLQIALKNPLQWFVRPLQLIFSADSIKLQSQAALCICYLQSRFMQATLPT